MKDLNVPNDEEMDILKGMVEFNPDEKVYWEGVKERENSEFGKEHSKEKAEFYLNELKAVKGRFGERVAVKRRLKYLIGYSYEWLGTYGLEGHEPEERAKAFEKAVIWYQFADEAVGFLTDYALRQAESCFGAAKYRSDAGLEGVITMSFTERGADLIKSFFDGALGGKADITIVGGKMPKFLKQIAGKTIDSVVTAYLFKKHKGEYDISLN
ncbi:MAG TPA: hypothetical protein HA282_00965 [Nanoarchaeota archaeon]|nr:hypothetical protein [Candidatus Pacearchaeota archaeon]HIH18296.1 hypothetical protein [Nanoarchaeota archaeon]HIH34166.1 hypothetical protein [Nanoarchaeota archaeon]HIH51258.1 hypothetical protein [Nanoarchaeota archaeon]HIH65773.1 hypothetical protein [Nanoarchaeota archaeon]